MNFIISTFQFTLVVVLTLSVLWWQRPTCSLVLPPSPPSSISSSRVNNDTYNSNEIRNTTLLYTTNATITNSDNNNNKYINHHHHQGPKNLHTNSSLFAEQSPVTNVPKPANQNPSFSSASNVDSHYGRVVILSNGVEFKLYAIQINSSKVSGTPITLKLDRLADRRRHWITSIDYFFDETHRTCQSELEWWNSQDSSARTTTNVNDEYEKKCLVIFWIDGWLKEMRTAAMQLLVEKSTNRIVESSLNLDAGTKSPQISLRYFGKIANSSQRIKHRENNSRIINDLLIDHDSKTLFLSIKQDDDSFIIISNIYDPSKDHQMLSIFPGSADKLSVDYRERVLFYLDTSGSINRISLSNKIIVNIAPNVRAKCLTINQDEKRVYWLTADGYLYSINYQGREKRCVMHLNSRRPMFDPFAMRIINGTLYFSDTSKHSLIKAGANIHELRCDELSDWDITTTQNNVLAVESPATYGFQFVKGLMLALEMQSSSRKNNTNDDSVRIVSPNAGRNPLSTALVSPTDRISETPRTYKLNESRTKDKVAINGISARNTIPYEATVVIRDIDWKDELELSQRVPHAVPHQTSSLWKMTILIGSVITVFLALLLTLYCLRKRSGCLEDGASPLINEYQPSFVATTSKISSNT